MIQQALLHWEQPLFVEKMMRDSEQKKLALIKSADGQSFYLKVEKYMQQEAEKVCSFANELAAILPTPTYLKTRTGTYTVEADSFIYTLETAFLEGEEIEAVTDGQIVAIAKGLAEMHSYCEARKIILQKPTSWAMFGGNETDALGHYDENELSFFEFKKKLGSFEQFSQIEQLYMNYREQLKQLWPRLPTYATQGDFCYYNMWFKGDELVGICDVNLAGDEVYVNEFMALAVYIAWHAFYKGTSSNETKYKLFTEAYETIRPLNALEQEAKPLLFKIIRAFRFDRVEDGIERVDEHEAFVQETLRLLK